MEPNPYQSSLTAGVRQLERLTMSPMRIPLAVVCCAFALLFLATLFSWSFTLLQDGIASEDGRLATVYAPLSIVGILSFGLLAAGLIGKMPRTIGLGIGLFAIGAMVQIIIMLVA